MVENPTPAPPPAQDSTTTVVKQRYAPPNQRNRSLNRRKSGGFDRSNNAYVSDGEKNQVNASSSNVLNENPPRQKLIALEGCSKSEAAQLLNNRWAAAMQRYNDASIDSSERPVMYSASGGAAAWTQFRLPHQIMPPPNSVGPSSGPPMDFLAELRRAMRNSPASSDNLHSNIN